MCEMDRAKLVWLIPSESHYNTFFFEELQKAGINFLVVYGMEKNYKYPWKEELAHNYQKHTFPSLWKSVCFIYKEASSKQKTIFIIAGWRGGLFLLAMLIATMKSNSVFYFWTDTLNIKRRVLYRKIYRSTLIWYINRYSKGVLTTGVTGVEYAIKEGIKKELLKNFPFATNLSFFKPSSSIKSVSNLNSEPIVFVSVGRLDLSHKRQHDFLKALALVKKEIDTPFRYLIGGEGEDKFEIMDLVSKYDLSDEVDLRGWLEVNELFQFYNSGDVLVHSSSFDPFPNAVLEAMACGLPVIGSLSAGSVRDRVENGVSGFTHLEGDVDKLVEIVRLVSTDRSLLKKMGAAAREKAEHWDVAYNIGVINSIIDANNTESLRSV